MANTYSAGVVTAYGAAKRGGYTGTYEEFCAEQANFAKNAQQVREDREAVEQTVETFSEETVPEAIQSVTDEGSTQVGLVKTEGETQVGNVTNAGDEQVGNVNTAGSDNVSAVNTAGTTQVSAVNQAGAIQVGNVNQAGTTQTTAVNTAGATQVQAVEDKGAEVRASIPADYADLSEDVDTLKTALNDPVTGLDTKAPVILETASGDIASFNDGADSMPIKSLVATIEPVQDLHGYENPWPGGGNVNKLPPAANFETITVGNSKITPYPDGHYHLSKTAGSNADQIDINLATPVTVTTNQYINYISNGNAGNMVANLAGGSGMINGGYWGKLSANIANNGTATRWQFYFTATVAGEFDLWPIISDAPVSEFSPYSNICPISGWTGMSGKRCGKNLLRNNANTATVNGITFAVADDGTVTANGTATANADLILSRYNNGDINIINGEQYILSGCPTGGGTSSYRINMSDNITATYPDDGAGVTFSPSSEFIGSNPRVFIRIYNGVTVSNLVFKPMIRLASDTDSTFEPYVSTPISVSWESQAGTVYGGTLDVVSGEMRVDHQKLRSATWMRYNQTHCFYVTPTGYDRVNPTAISGALPTIEGGSFSDFTSMDYGVRPSNYLYVTIVGCETSDDVNNWIANNDADIVYKLATPIEYTLTPQEVTTLLGTNNVWTDVGPVSVTYPADTKLYVDNKIAEAVAAALNA